jgi:hypothetical protein
LHCRRSPGGDQLLLAVAGRGRPAVRSAGGAAVRVPRRGERLGLRRHRVPASGLPGGDPVGGDRVHVHVDQRGPLPGRAQAAPLRDPPDEDAVPVLDGLHLDLGGDAVLPAAARLQPAQVRRGRLHLHAGLGQHGRLLGHAGHPGARPQPHHHRLHLHLHLQHAAQAEERLPLPRQGVRHRPLGEPVQPQPLDVVLAGAGLLDLLDSLHRHPPVRVLHRCQVSSAIPTFRHRLAGLPQLLLEVAHFDHDESAVPPGAAHLLHDHLLPVQGQDAGGTHRDGGRRLTTLSRHRMLSGIAHHRTRHARLRVLRRQDQEVLVAVLGPRPVLQPVIAPGLDLCGCR